MFTEEFILLKVALIALVIICFALLLGLLYISFKILRKTQKEEALELKNSVKNYELHPKLKNKSEDK
jgi:hypothetical protein